MKHYETFKSHEEEFLEKSKEKLSNKQNLKRNALNLTIRMNKKWDFDNPKVINHALSSISMVFTIVCIPRGAKTVLSGEVLYTRLCK